MPLGPIAQLIASLIADPGFVSLSPAQPHTFVAIVHEIFSMVILLLPLIQEGLLSVTSESMCWLPLSLSLPRKKRFGEVNFYLLQSTIFQICQNGSSWVDLIRAFSDV